MSAVDFNALVARVRAAQADVDARARVMERAVVELRAAEDRLAVLRRQVEGLLWGDTPVVSRDDRGDERPAREDNPAPTPPSLQQGDDHARQPREGRPVGNVAESSARPDRAPRLAESPRSSGPITATSLSEQSLALIAAAKFRRRGGTGKGVPEQMAELFLAEPARTWANAELRERFNCSEQRVSSLVGALAKLGIGEQRGRGLYGAKGGGSAKVMVAAPPPSVELAPAAPVPAVSALSPDTAALVTGHVELVKKMAGHLAKNLPPHVSVDDLVGAGQLALVEVAQRFDPSTGASFRAYASHRIQGAMLDELRKNDTVSRDRRRAIREGTDSPDALPVPRLVEDTAAAAVPIEAEALDEQMDRLRRAVAVQAAVARLPPKLRAVYRQRVEQGWKLSQIASHFQVTEPRACQLYAEVVRRLREQIQEAA